MNILFIGRSGEIGVSIVNALSNIGAVYAAFSEKPVYEANCKTVPSSVDIGAVIQNEKIDVVICLEDKCGSIEEIERLLSVIADNADCILYYVKEQSFFRKRDTKADAAAWLCEGFSHRYGIKTVFLSTSCLYANGMLPEYPQKLLHSIDRHRELYPDGGEDEICDCLHIDDFCAALETIFHRETQNDYERIELQSAYPFLLSEFIEILSQRYNGISIQPNESEQDERSYTAYQSDSWAPEHSFRKDIPLLLDGVEDRRLNLRKRRRKAGLNIALKIGAFAVVFALVELYTQFIAVASDLQFVDMRLLFVVAASLLIGKRYGIFAAAMCSIASVIQSLLAGYRWYVLFYHVDNWIPIAVYFIIAILIGLYLDKREKRDQDD